MAMRDPTLNDVELHERLINLRESTTTRHIQLFGIYFKKKIRKTNIFFFKGLDNRYLATLACQTMFVQRISKDLELLITRKSDKFVMII